MSLKKRLIFLLLFSGFTLAFSFFLSFKIFMLPSLRERKLSHIDNLKKKFENALSFEEQKIAILCEDWAGWERLKAYVENPSVAFEKEAFPDTLFLEDQLDIILVLDLDTNIIFYKGYWQDKRFIDLKDLKIGNAVSRIPGIIKGRPKIAKSIINSNYEPIMIVTHPITAVGKPEEIIAALVLGKFIDQKMIKRFSQYTMENIKISALDKQQMNAFYLNSMKGENFYYSEKRDIISTFNLLKDINDQPSLLLTSTSNNRVFRVVGRHTAAFITIVSFLTILLGVMLYHYIDRHMIKRMREISNTMSKIEGLEDLSIRINRDKKEDEISHLISSLNFTLDKLENEKINRENAEKAMITQGKLASIGKLSSNIAHEINNPILAISNTIQVIKKSIKGKNKLLQEAIAISESELDRIRKIISGLLDFHRSEKEFTSLNIKDVIFQVLEVLKWSNKLKLTKIIHKMEEDCFVYGYPVKLEEVIMNIISNAVEAMEDMGAEGKLKIEVLPEESKNFVEIHFIDNGPGLPQEVKNSLFEPFVSTKGKKGVGLGLYIAYKLVKIHHGDIIYNDDYKNGAYFIIKLPKSRRSLNE